MSDDTKSGKEKTNPAGKPPLDSPLRLAFDKEYESDWRKSLRFSESGRVLPSLENVYSVLFYHPEWKGVIAFDELIGGVVKTKAPPFGDAAASLGEWTDDDDGRLALWLAQQLRIEPKDRTLSVAVRNIADSNRFHPVRDYLRGLKWDGTERLRYWLQAYLGAEPIEYQVDGKKVDYSAAVGSKFLIGAVARVMRPGCKMDNVMILEGVQGLGKSSAMGVLFSPWFTDQQIKIGEKDTYEIMRGQWGMELAELDALSKAEVAAAKAFFSRSSDRFRSFYGRRAANVPRQSVFVGTVNHGQYLRDSSGNRRYWPVACRKVELKDLGDERDQLWAEAFKEYEKGVPWWVTGPEGEMFRAEQEKRYVGDALEERIRRWLNGDAQHDIVAKNEATMSQILQHGLGLDPSKWTQAEQIRVGIIMERLPGWRVGRQRQSDGTRVRVYERIST